MEAGRDKAYKNKIEVNDPVMLVGLAEAYYRNKKFSENLEIYFEIGKQYPVVTPDSGGDAGHLFHGAAECRRGKDFLV